MTEGKKSSFIAQILDGLFGGIKRSIEKQIDDYVRKIINTLVLSLVGIVLLSAGMIFALQGVIILLGEFMPIWLSWSVVGIIITLVGIILLMSVRRR
jgi:hypothetical protein